MILSILRIIITCQQSSLKDYLFNKPNVKIKTMGPLWIHFVCLKQIKMILIVRITKGNYSVFISCQSMAEIYKRCLISTIKNYQ